ncbi:hypothetical protein [Leuconostoc pseudomesenteroides]|uniref:hypothetical protein n=1 Tax=Leuconostoc pseudomesenteroides TaxID=33968 RepID=UPI004035392B
MKNSHETIKQDVMRSAAIREIKQTIGTFTALETNLDRLLEVELAQLGTQYQHLLELANTIDDVTFSTQLSQFADNRLKIRRLRIKTLVMLSRESTVNAKEILEILESRQIALAKESNDDEKKP